MRRQMARPQVTLAWEEGRDQSWELSVRQCPPGLGLTGG